MRGLGTCCAVRGCKNTQGKLNVWLRQQCLEHAPKTKKECSCERKYRFYRLPKEKELKKIWLKNLNLSKSPQTLYVCSVHFVDKKPTEEHPHPTLCLGSDKPQEEKRKRQYKRRRQELKRVDRSATKTAGRQQKGNHKRKGKNVNPDFVPSVSINPKKKPTKASSPKTDEVPDSAKEITPQKPKEISLSTTLLCGKDIEIEWPNLVELSVEHKQLQATYTFLQSEVDTLSAENDRLKEDLYRVLPRFCYTSVKGDDEQLLFITGLHSLVFDWLDSQVSAKIEGVLPELTSRDHLLLILMKLKLGLCDTDLAYRFRVQEFFVSRICQAWIPALAAVLRPLVAWPSAQIVSQSRPSFFRGKFRRCRCVIDCPEFVTARVDGNECKQESTVKYFVSVTPAGAVSFLSSGYSGLTPERTIVQESGFLHLVDPHDEILANRCIPIRDELTSLRAALHIPDPNNGKQTQKSDFEKQFSHIWAHVKKVTEWWKEFNILQKVIPQPYADFVDEILIVCAVLTNVKISLAPKGNNQL